MCRIKTSKNSVTAAKNLCSPFVLIMNIMYACVRSIHFFIILALYTTKMDLKVQKKTLHNSWRHQEHSPGGRRICGKVNNQEKTSPELSNTKRPRRPRKTTVVDGKNPSQQLARSRTLSRRYAVSKSIQKIQTVHHKM